MLRIKAYLDSSPIHGTGVFAAEYIPAGTLVWSFDPIDRLITPEEMDAMTEEQKDRLLCHVFWASAVQSYVLCGDGGMYTNHSEAPNCSASGDLESVADRDIHPGEEITENYREYGQGPYPQFQFVWEPVAGEARLLDDDSMDCSQAASG